MLSITPDLQNTFVYYERRLSFALQADLRSFNFAAGKISLPCGPSRGCSLKLMDPVLNITFSVMARRASHRDVTTKFDPIELSRFAISVRFQL